MNVKAHYFPHLGYKATTAHVFKTKGSLLNRFTIHKWHLLQNKTCVLTEHLCNDLFLFFYIFTDVRVQLLPSGDPHMQLQLPLLLELFW